jgi:DNA-binding transcriptional ArsR family regulator
MSSEEMPGPEVGPPEAGRPEAEWPEVERPEVGQRALTDPKAMRALAHPVRIALLEALRVRVSLTATQASEMLGESPANCAFHLRTLAKYGFVREAGGGRGRERPWMQAQRYITISPEGQKDEQAALAARTLAQVFRDRWLERIRRVFTAESWPEGWQGAVRGSRNVHFLTAAETEQVGDEIHELLRRYEDRRYDPSLRPAGSLPVEFTFFGFPLTEFSPDDSTDSTEEM